MGLCRRIALKNVTVLGLKKPSCANLSEKISHSVFIHVLMFKVVSDTVNKDS